MSKKFIEVEVHNHLILHGFDADNKEIIEEVTVNEPMLKSIAVERIQSLSEKSILTTYAFDRLIYWEYTNTYDEIKKALNM